MRNISAKFLVEIKTHILWSVHSFFQNRAKNGIIWKKYSRMGQATDGAFVFHAGYVGYKLTLTICNTYFFILRHWSHEYASMLDYAYIAVLLKLNLKFGKGIEIWHFCHANMLC